MRLFDGFAKSVENYVEQISGPPPEGWLEARKGSDLLQKTPISLGFVESQVISFLIRQHQCKRFVEVGSLTGASALWILKAMPVEGKLWTLEKDPKHAEIAKKILASDSRATVVEGDARETLRAIESEGPFDGIFIDGNKAAYGDYLDWAEMNLISGGLIIADNVFLGGSVFEDIKNSQFSEKQVNVMKLFNQRLANEEIFHFCLIPTAEGLMVAIKK
jgi:predicted O-methyltransferase YrrM